MSFRCHNEEVSFSACKVKSSCPSPQLFGGLSPQFVATTVSIYDKTQKLLSFLSYRQLFDRIILNLAGISSRQRPTAQLPDKNRGLPHCRKESSNNPSGIAQLFCCFFFIYPQITSSLASSPPGCGCRQPARCSSGSR